MLPFLIFILYYYYDFVDQYLVNASMDDHEILP